MRPFRGGLKWAAVHIYTEGMATPSLPMNKSRQKNLVTGILGRFDCCTQDSWDPGFSLSRRTSLYCHQVCIEEVGQGSSRDTSHSQTTCHLWGIRAFSGQMLKIRGSPLLLSCQQGQKVIPFHSAPTALSATTEATHTACSSSEERKACAFLPPV